MAKNFIKIIALILLTFGSVSLSLAQKTVVHSESFVKGETDAAENVKNEKFVLKAWGLSSSSFYSWQSAKEIYTSILKENTRLLLNGLAAVWWTKKQPTMWKATTKFLSPALKPNTEAAFLKRLENKPKPNTKVNTVTGNESLTENLKEELTRYPKEAVIKPFVC